MPPTWRCRVCRAQGNRGSRCNKCKTSVKKTADISLKEHALLHAILRRE